MSEITFTITRWTLLRVWPSAWREVLRGVELNGAELRPWHPYALVLFVVGGWALLTARRPS